MVYLITSEFFILIFFSLLLLLVEIAACGYFAGVDLRESRCGGFHADNDSYFFHRYISFGQA
jgi:hypothetical protein